MAKGKRVSDPEALAYIRDKLAAGQALGEEDRARLRQIARPDLISLIEEHQGEPLRSTVKNSVESIIRHLLGPEPVYGLPLADLGGKRRRVELRMVEDPDNPGTMKLAPVDEPSPASRSGSGTLPPLAGGTPLAGLPLRGGAAASPQQQPQQQQQRWWGATSTRQQRATEQLAEAAALGGQQQQPAAAGSLLPRLLLASQQQQQPLPPDSDEWVDMELQRLMGADPLLASQLHHAGPLPLQGPAPVVAAAAPLLQQAGLLAGGQLPAGAVPAMAVQPSAAGTSAAAGPSWAASSGLLHPPGPAGQLLPHPQQQHLQPGQQLSLQQPSARARSGDPAALQWVAWSLGLGEPPPVPGGSPSIAGRRTSSDPLLGGASPPLAATGLGGGGASGLAAGGHFGAPPLPTQGVGGAPWPSSSTLLPALQGGQPGALAPGGFASAFAGLPPAGQPGNASSAAAPGTGRHPLGAPPPALLPPPIMPPAAEGGEDAAAPLPACSEQQQQQAQQQEQGQQQDQPQGGSQQGHR